MCVPLYACESCGFTSAAFRPEAARLHRLEYPACDGVMRIIFRSEERSRGQLYVQPPASAPLEPLTSPEGQAPAGKDAQTFAIRETVDEDQMRRLTLFGDLDLTAADTLSTRLPGGPKSTSRSTRLDLSQLAFIDSTGVQALLLALTDARWTGWPLEVAAEISPTIERAARIVGIAQVLWPSEVGPSRADQAATEPTGTA